MKLRCIFLSCARALCLLAIVPASVRAQEPKWRTIQPTAEEYKVELPATPTRFIQILPLSQDAFLSADVYDVVLNATRFQVIAFGKRTKNAIPMLTDFPSFITGFEKLFLDGGNRSLTLERTIDKASQQYVLRLENESGLVRFVEAQTHFYALVVVGGGETDPLVDRFLKSFRIRPLNLSPNPFPDRSATNTPQPVTPSDIWLASKTPQQTPIRVGILNGRAIDLPMVRYPKGARASGRVSVQVLVDENGNVVSADAVDGPQELRQAATDAAMKARFFQTRLLGNPVRVIGTTIYGFVFGQ